MTYAPDPDSSPQQKRIWAWNEIELVYSLKVGVSIMWLYNISNVEARWCRSHWVSSSDTQRRWPWLWRTRTDDAGGFDGRPLKLKMCKQCGVNRETRRTTSSQFQVLALSWLPLSSVITVLLLSRTEAVTPQFARWVSEWLCVSERERSSQRKFEKETSETRLCCWLAIYLSRNHMPCQTTARDLESGYTLCQMIAVISWTPLFPRRNPKVLA